MHCRPATPADIRLLAEMNARLIRDEAHRNPMTVDQLQQRIAQWLARPAACSPPHLNSDVVNGSFEQFTRAVDPDVHVVMFWDQAGFHAANKVRPPSCPEFGPIEKLWHDVRAHHWSNRSPDDCDALREVGCDV